MIIWKITHKYFLYYCGCPWLRDWSSVDYWVVRAPAAPLPADERRPADERLEDRRYTVPCSGRGTYPFETTERSRRYR